MPRAGGGGAARLGRMSLAPPLTRPPLLRLVSPPPRPADAPLPLPAATPARPAAEADPALERVAAAFHRVLAETISGRRPLAQLLPMLGPAPAQVVAELVRARHGGVRFARPRLQQPRPGVIESSTLMALPAGSCALAARLELHGGRWLAVAVETALVNDARPRG